ncbi:hypothetical protein E6O75_ATG08088 [Venturia nashicola]|uniref:Uncharacterized protein n=1 Tax=Venturia nashicola TaxID=86259 RepID=A0A4Z1NMX8_9PEZI|nr:hypothetical protein E6O75_ATG08088 [Venturia nashicola]
MIQNWLHNLGSVPPGLRADLQLDDIEHCEATVQIIEEGYILRQQEIDVGIWKRLCHLEQIVPARYKKSRLPPIHEQYYATPQIQLEFNMPTKVEVAR